MKTSSVCSRSLSPASILIGLLVIIIPDLRAAQFASYGEAVSGTHFFQRPIVWVGVQPPEEAESQVLYQLLDTCRASDYQTCLEDIEQFFHTYTNSAWAPSLHSQLGAFYRERGRYTLALAHWQSAWLVTRNATEGPAKEVADFTLAHFTRLLASLGRLETLDEVFAETYGRVLDLGPLQQMYHNTFEAYVQMHREPGHSYRCGALAIRELALLLQGRDFDASVVSVPSPATGFSVADLANMSAKLGLGLVPVVRRSGERIVVPSVILWNQAHYAAIVASEETRLGPLYQVIDPTFGRPQWLAAEAINSEASGVFLVPNTALPLTGWRMLTPGESGTLFGRGNPSVMVTSEDQSCSGCNCPTGSGGGGGGSGEPIHATGGSDTQKYFDPNDACQYCRNFGSGPGARGVVGASPPSGMPVWRVSEPHLNLWLDDEPLGYSPARGPRVSFSLSFKQRDEDSNLDPNAYSVGKSWNSAVVTHVYSLYDSHYNAGTGADVYMPGGGKSHFSNAYYGGVEFNYFNNTALQASTNGSGQITSYQLTTPEGARYVYAFFQSDPYGNWNNVFLSQIIDANGYVTTYNYATYDPDTEIVQLTSITDPDGRSTTFSYSAGVSAYPNLISQVVDPFSRTNLLKYNSSGLLTNITDVANLSSSVSYDLNGWVATLTTPYGTTSFTVTDSGGIDIYGAIDRSVLIAEPGGGHQLYVFREYSPQLPNSYPASDTPTNTPLNTLSSTLMNYNNTFYWNRLQYSVLSTTNMASFTSSDYLKARMRHWLYENGFDSSPTGTISLEREPSPDGTTEGQKTWYDYDGRSGGDSPSIGTQILPGVVARVLPDGSTWYTWYSRNSYGMPTRSVETYTKTDGTIGTRTNTFTRASNGIDLVTWMGPNNEMLAGYSYNSYSQPLTFTNAVGDITTFTYDTTNHLNTSIVRPGGLTTTNFYNSDNRLIQTIDTPVNRTNSFSYYSHGLVLTHTDERNVTVTNYWDNLQRLTGSAYPDGTVASNVYTYLDLTGTKDRLGNWTYLGFDSLRRRVAVTNANSVITRYGYCECGSLTYLTNAYGLSLQEVTQFIYDYQGNRLQTYSPDGTAVTNKFDSMGRITNRLDSLSSTTFWFNNQGLVAAVSNGVGQVTATVYDNRDRALYVTDASGVTVTNAYDSLSRLSTRTYPDGGVEKFSYTSRGLTNYANQLNLTNWYVLDAAGRKTSETNANNEVIKYSYNAASDLLTLTDGKGQVTTWNYDQYGRVTNKLDQASVEILRYSYDANSRLTNRWSKAKGNTAYSYDNDGNLTLVNYPASTDITLQYDALDRLTNMVDAAGTTKFAYYAGGLLWTEDGPWTSDTLTNTYNGARLKSGSVLQQPSGTWTNGFSYDGARRLSTVTSLAGTFIYAYSPGVGAATASASLVKKLTLPNSGYVTNTYDTVARLTGTYLDNSANTILDKSEYLYNAGNQRIRQTRTDASYYTNTYDNIGQLKVADSTVNTEDRGYLYDAAWNLASRTNNGTATSFTADSKNQLTGGPTANYGYDNNGNLISSSSGQITYTYDDENRLTTWQNTTIAKTDFVYDGLSRLRKRIEYTWNSVMALWQVSNETRYIYDGMLVIQERNSSNTPTVSYTQGSDLSGSFQGAGGISGLMARSHGYSSGTWSGHNFYHADGGGNVTMLIDNAGTPNVTATYRYDPFGNSISSTGTNAANNVKRFSSKERHANSGMYYYGSRFYDPNLQRWLNRDLIAEDGGINLYGFVGNRPNIWVDPYGLDFLHWWMDFTEPLRRNNIDPNMEHWSPDDRFDPGLQPSLLGDLLMGGFGNAMRGPATLKICPKIVPVSRWGRDGLKPGDWVMPGRPTMSNYLRSGKWDPFPWNRYAPFRTGQQYLVSPNDIFWPSGWNWWKGLLGQRIYDPFIL